MVDNGYRLHHYSNINICSLAARHGHFDVFKYGVENDCPLNSTTFNEAVKKDNNMKIIKYLFTNKCNCDDELLPITASHGNLEYMKFFLKHSYPCSSTTMIEAVRSGNLELVKFLREHGVSWYMRISSEVKPTFDNIDCIIYAYKNGCNWSSNAYIKSGKNS